MCWQCDNPGKTTDDYLAEVVVPAIECHGWFVQAVLGGRSSAPFAYTVGLTEHGSPELVVTGMPHYRSRPLLDAMAAHWLHAEPPPVHGEHVELADACLEVVQLPHPEAHLFTATALFGEEGVRAAQLVWADGRGRWPWERGHRAGRGGQPVLGPRAGSPGPCSRSATAAGNRRTPGAGGGTSGGGGGRPPPVR